MNGEFDALPGDVQKALASARVVSMPNDARGRLAERLSASIVGFGPVHAPSAASVAPATSGALSSAAAKALVVLAVAGGAAGLFGAARSSSPSNAPAHAVPVVARELATHAPHIVTFTPDVTRADSPPAPQLVLRAPTVTPAALTADASLREEQTLLDQARRAIVSGDPTRALAPLKTHAARFPHGVLAEERDALDVRALARLGRQGDARALLDRMRKDYPRSFLLEGAADDVESIP